MTVSTAIRITDPGWISTFQDLGRQGSEALGVPSGGAADQFSTSVANILVGNSRASVCLETMGGRLSFIPDRDVLMSVTGTPVELTIGGRPCPLWTPLAVPAGAPVTLSHATGGVRSYVAFAGELDAERFMGSAAPDQRMGFPQQLLAGQTLTLRSGYAGFSHPFSGQLLFRLPVPVPELPAGAWTIDVVDGPETAAVPGIRELMASSAYTVGARSNHVGLRLSGPVLHPEGLGEIVSHGVPVGAVEIPHSDELIILGRYRTLTAGYPIVAVATMASLARLGQAGPGRQLRFRWVERRESLHQLRRQEELLEDLEDAVRRAFSSSGLHISARTA